MIPYTYHFCTYVLWGMSSLQVLTRPLLYSVLYTVHCVQYSVFNSSFYSSCYMYSSSSFYPAPYVTVSSAPPPPTVFLQLLLIFQSLLLIFCTAPTATHADVHPAPAPPASLHLPPLLLLYYSKCYSCSCAFCVWASSILLRIFLLLLCSS